MSFDKILGPAMIVYLISVTVAALWWASDLTRRVATVEASTVTGERIARLEAEVRGLGERTKELRSSVQELIREIRQD